LSTLIDRLDILLLAVFSSQAIVGYYEIAWRLTAPAIFLAQSISAGVMTKISSNPTSLTHIIKEVSPSTILTYPMVVGGILVGQPLLIIVFGTEYSNAYPLLILVLLYRLVYCYNQPHANILLGADYPKVVFRGQFIMFLLNVIISSILAIYMGSVGIVVGTIAAELIYFAYHLLAVHSVYDRVAIYPRISFYQIMGSILMGAIILTILYLIEIYTLPRLAGIISLGVIVYSFYIIILGERMGMPRERIVTIVQR
jgi:O-antigen/teichoic acid export membrane protein